MLIVPSGPLLELDNCYFVLVISKNILFIFLMDIKVVIKGKYCSFDNNDVYYNLYTYTNGLYIHYLEMFNFNINCMDNKIDIQYPYYLWYYILIHINETKTTKLQKKRYLILLIMNHMKLVKLVYWVK